MPKKRPVKEPEGKVKRTETSPSFLVKPGDLKKKQAGWRERGHNEEEVESLTELFLEVSQIQDRMREISQNRNPTPDQRNTMNAEITRLKERVNKIKVLRNILLVAVVLREQKEERQRKKEKAERAASEAFADLPPDMAEAAEKVRKDTEGKINLRAKRLGSLLEFQIDRPNVPEGLTMEHLQVINEVFNGKLALRMLPTAEELHDLGGDYLDLMYPRKKTSSRQKGRACCTWKG